jgi:hypothetical protein
MEGIWIGPLEQGEPKNEPSGGTNQGHAASRQSGNADALFFVQKCAVLTTASQRWHSQK